jgi:hypothetical protein
MSQSSQTRHVQRPFRYVPAFFMNSCVKSTPFWPCYLIKTTLVKKNIISVIIITLILPVFRFSSLVSVFRNAGSQDHHTTPHCIVDTWNCCFFVLSGTHITPDSLSFLCILCFASSLLGLPMEKICHSRCVVCGWRTLPLAYITYLNNESLNCLSDNSEQAVIKTHLFKMVRPKMRKNSFFICLHIYLLLGYSSSYHQVSTHTACVS